MVKTNSKMVSLSSSAYKFSLVCPYDNKYYSYNELKSDITVVVFMCNHCPYVIKIIKELTVFHNNNKTKNKVSVIGINSNDVITYPEDSPEKMIEFQKTYKFNFKYLFDKTQVVAKMFGAECTPDFFVYNNYDKLIYRGRFDSSTPGNNLPSTGDDLKNAIHNYINFNRVLDIQNPSIGCNIKWKI